MFSGTPKLLKQSFGLGSTIAGIILMVVGIVLLFVFVLNLSQSGRRFLAKLVYAWNKNFLKLMLLVLSLIYIPVTNSILGLYNCQTVTCPNGTTFAPEFYTFAMGNLPIDQFRRKTGEMCDSCQFNSSCPIADKLCKGGTDSRMASNAGGIPALTL